ncbi:hypothetical protein HY622_04080 [Candidatus Uhrbacteria bacterium]|nr:hypothetical protein [Candidatus Uhrbacteria bacterium]
MVDNLQRLREVIEEMTNASSGSVVTNVRLGAVIICFAPHIVKEKKLELVALLNLIFPINGGGVRNGMTSEDFNKILRDPFLTVQVIAAGSLLQLWNVAEATNGNRLIVNRVRLW